MITTPFSLVKSLLPRLWFYAAGERWRIVLYYAMFTTSVLIVLWNPVAVERIISALQKPEGPDLHLALVWCGIYILIEIGMWSFHAPARMIERRLAFRLYHRFVSDLYRKVTELPLRWHQDHHSGDTINRVTKAGRAFFTFAQQQFFLLQISVRFIGTLAMLAWYCWWISAAMIVFCAFILWIIVSFDRRIVPLANATNEKEHRLNAALYDYIGNIVTVLTLRLQGHTRQEIHQRFGAMKAPFQREILLHELKWMAVTILFILIQGGTIAGYIAVTLKTGQTLHIGYLVAILQYQLGLNMVFRQVIMLYNDMLHWAVDVEAVDPMLADHAGLVIPSSGGAAEAWRAISIRDLIFTHQEEEDKPPLHIDGVSLDMQPGMKIALVGSSGAGKSTLLALLRGNYEAQSVGLTIDGKLFNSLRPLSGLSTLVPQDAEIFENTVRYNITLGLDVSEAVVAEAMEMAAFEEVLPKLPHGLETDIRERGVNLSGGQKQRLALARGFIAARDSSILLLDEPTSSVDVMTEGRIFDRLFAIYGEKTIVASIHRLHLLPRFDWICYMEGGRIVQQGRFRELVTADGALRALWEG